MPFLMETYTSHLLDLGALCFTYKNYKEKIQKILETCEVKYDLSDPDFNWSWSLLSNLHCLPIDNLVICDPYILNNNDNQRMDRNVIPLLDTLISNSAGNKKISLFTSFSDAEVTTGELRNKHSLMNSQLAKWSFKLSIFNFGEKGKYQKALATLDFHDRLIYSSFFVIEVGKGFNLIGSKDSTSKLETTTIFEKFTYNRIRNHHKALKDFAEKIIRDYPAAFYPNNARLPSLIE